MGCGSCIATTRLIYDMLRITGGLQMLLVDALWEWHGVTIMLITCCESEMSLPSTTRRSRASHGHTVAAIMRISPPTAAG